MDNLAYIDDVPRKEKTELINGKIFLMSPRPRVTHATACTKFAIILPLNWSISLKI